MTGRIESGQLCTVVPTDSAVLEVWDILPCKVAGNEYLHIVKAIEHGRYQIGNNSPAVSSRASLAGETPTLETLQEAAVNARCR
jgi:hypothetical protein